MATEFREISLRHKTTLSQMCKTYFLSIKVSLQRVVAVEQPFTRHSFTEIFQMRRKIEKKINWGKWSEATKSIEIRRRLISCREGQIL